MLDQDDEEEDQIDEDLNSNEGELTFAQTREIKKISRKIMEILMDSTILENIQKSIQETLKNFKPKKETITILRSEFAVLTEVNGINHFGIEGLNNNVHQWLVQIFEQIDKMKEFPQKESLISDCLQAISNYICITWS